MTKHEVYFLPLNKSITFDELGQYEKEDDLVEYDVLTFEVPELDVLYSKIEELSYKYVDRYMEPPNVVLCPLKYYLAFRYACRHADIVTLPIGSLLLIPADIPNFLIVPNFEHIPYIIKEKELAYEKLHKTLKELETDD